MIKTLVPFVTKTLGILVIAVVAEARDGSIPQVPDGHPRLYIQKHEISSIRKRITREPWKDIWNDLQQEKEPVAQALVYLIEGDEEAGRCAIAEALKRIEGRDIVADTRHFDSAVHQSACVYDWCYPLLTSDQRARFVEKFTSIPNLPNKSGKIYIGYPARMDSLSATGHQSEGHLITSQLPAGIAIYDENQELYDAAARLFFQKFVPVRNFHYASHSHHQGTFYGVGRFHFDVQASWYFRSLGARDIFSEEQQFVPYFYLYTRQPDGTSFPVGDAIAGGGPEEVYAKVGSYYGDPYLLGQAPRRLGGPFGRLFDLLYRDYKTETKPITDLPLTKYFPSPTGLMVARTGWDISPDSRDAVTVMNIGETFFGNHQHYDAGSFQVSYRGPLAISSGYYDDFGGQHNRNYYNSSISKNSLLVRDPDEKIRFNRKVVANDGGSSEHEEEKIEGLPVHRMANVLAHSFGPELKSPDYSYISGDLKPGYGEKVVALTRSMVTLNLKNDTHPSSLIVFDRVTASHPEFRKTFLVHSVEEPEIGNSTFTIVRAGKNPGTRNVRLPSDARFGGKLVAECLLPEGAQITKVGGEGKEAWVDGKNYPPIIKKSKGLAFNPGAWRVEVSPRQPSAADRFLHVMTVMDAETQESPEVQRIDANDATGVSIRDRIVLFSKSTRQLDTVRFDIPSRDEKMKVLVCDLQPGTYALELDEQTTTPDMQSDIQVDRAGRCAYFLCESGRVTLRRVAKKTP